MLLDKYVFSSANYFSSVYKKYYGCSPSAYRQKHESKLTFKEIL